jgi:SH3-like domain-containing protein
MRHSMRRSASRGFVRANFIILLIAAVGLGLALPLGPAAAQDQPLPLPRFASLDSGEANLRAGPGKDYPILWVYQRKGLPVEIIQEFDTWRRIRDRDGTVGWVQQNLLSGKRTGLIIDQQRTLRAEPGSNDAVARLQPGVVARIEECRSDDWCKLEAQGYRGWLTRDEFFGAYPDEAFESD